MLLTLSPQDQSGLYYIDGNPYKSESLNDLIEYFMRASVNEEGLLCAFRDLSTVILSGRRSTH